MDGIIMTDTLRDKNRRERIRLTVVTLVLVVTAMFVSAAWLRPA